MTPQSSPSAFVGPTSKERKYDRQLRLWAASGQQALEDSRVLLVNSDGAVDNDGLPLTGVIGTETLKNLVLPGIGGYAIVDPATVTEADLGVNFFLEESSLGKSRAEETCNYLRELNPDVEGLWFSQPISQILSSEKQFLMSYRLVIVTGPMRRSTLQIISEQTNALSIPLIYAHSVGFYCSVSIQLPSLFPIVETHPDPESTQDLRLTNPWPELLAATKRLGNLETLDDHQHGHIPYLLLLLHYLERWKEGHNGIYPKTYQEKTEFRSMVRSGARTNTAEGGEENFDEAAGAVLKSINSWSLSSELRSIFQMEQCTLLNAQSHNFWVIANAVKTFYNKHDVLPLPGSLPDMKAQSADYISLQNIYKSKARKDLAEVVASVRALESLLGGDRIDSPISEREIEIFCKNAAHIKVIQGRLLPFLDPHTPTKETAKMIQDSLRDPESLMSIFIALRALDILVSEYQEAKPGPAKSGVADSASWQRAASVLLRALETHEVEIIDEAAQVGIQNAMEEARRAGTGELHNISSIAGGVVAQEALKLLTRQYVPLDNTFVFDGVRSHGQMFKL
ncbi:hypothetical protein LOZ55_003362 [Ophidiomyces ophidiicola]|nr:hypothetical protein LOZ55_003362 [Ophidiomyces ophidiicola]KAI1994950.1 hypothetical protein LOZ54_000803 [Ophidiomyces ophidiicola]